VNSPLQRHTVRLRGLQRQRRWQPQPTHQPQTCHPERHRCAWLSVAPRPGGGRRIC